MQTTHSPDKFAERFNSLFPGAYRQVDTQDILALVKCGLVCKYGFYSRDDLEVIRGILQYEQLREERSQPEDTPKTCKRCGELLLDNAVGKGRPREYCQQCEPYRNRARYSNWKLRHTVIHN